MLKKVSLSLVLIAGIGGHAMAACVLTGPMSKEAIASRLQPPGVPEVVVAGGGAAVPAAPLVAAHPGKKIYDTSCTACHSIGVAGAPKLGDKAAWEVRLKKGIETLLKHVHEGYNAMPAGGACPQCTSEDHKHAIEYMSGTTL